MRWDGKKKQLKGLVNGKNLSGWDEKVLNLSLGSPGRVRDSKFNKDIHLMRKLLFLNLL